MFGPLRKIYQRWRGIYLLIPWPKFVMVQSELLICDSPDRKREKPFAPHRHSFKIYSSMIWKGTRNSAFKRLFAQLTVTIFTNRPRCYFVFSIILKTKSFLELIIYCIVLNLCFIPIWIWMNQARRLLWPQKNVIL